MNVGDNSGRNNNDYSSPTNKIRSNQRSPLKDSAGSDQKTTNIITATFGGGQKFLPNQSKYSNEKPLITQSSKGGMSVDDLDKYTSPAKI